MPKGKSAANDLAVRLDWPHAAAPLAADRGSSPPSGANGKDREPVGLTLVVQRLDALIVQVQALTEQVEALARRATENPAKGEAATQATQPATAAPPGPPAPRPATRRRTT